MTVEKIVPWYIRKLPELIVLALLLGAGWYYGHWREQVGKQGADLACRKAQDKANAIAQAKADELNERLRKALQRPSVAQGVERVVIENPSGCKLPDAVARSLQDGIADANRATE